MGERGQAMVLFAIILPLFLALGSFVITVGNWWVHKRHLQTQVDAAALSGAPEFVGCFHLPDAANPAIAAAALEYAGDTLRDPTAATSYNLQVQQPGDVRVVLNSSSYWAQVNGTDPNTPSPGYGLDYSMPPIDSKGRAAPDSQPCSVKALDVKATDDEAPTLWGWLPFVASPKTHAKVEIFDLESASGMLPWAVPEIDPRRVVALYVNEQNGSVFDFQLLDKTDIPSLPWSEWTTSSGQEPVRLESANDRTSVVILVSKNDDVPDLQVTGTLAQICGQDPGLVRCYAGSSQTSGLSFIHGYNGGGAGTLASPIIRQVELLPIGCDPQADLSAAYFTLVGDCTATIQAVVDFGNLSGDPDDFPNCVLVDASPGGALTWSAGGLGGSRGTWTGSFGLVANSGRNQVSLSWSSGKRPNDNNCPNPNQQPNSGSLGVVAAPYVANSASGPVQYLKLTALKNDLTPVADANSVEKNDPGQTYYYTVTVGLPKPLSVGNYTDPPLLLRMASPSGSQNRAFDCDKNINFEAEVENGCQTRYTENYVDDDGDPATPKVWNNFLCTGYFTGNLPPDTFDPSPRPDCVMTETGDKTGQLRQGLAARFETPSCVPNNWPDTPAEAATFFGPDGGGYGEDPRYVILIITDDTAFTGSGNEPLPLKYFAGFYATGWDIGGATSGCPDPDGPSGPLKGNDPHPIYGSNYPQSRDNGDVWGYFVDIVLFSSSGDPNENELCVFGEDPAACIAVLTE